MNSLILFAIFSILFSFLCSILEAVLLSITPTFIEVKKKEGKKYAYQIEKNKNDIDKPLIAILTLNTIAHTVGAIGVGASAKDAFGTDNNYVPIVSGVMTILILVVSEIIPKTIGARYWKKLAHFSAFTLNLLIAMMKYSGIMWTLQLITKWIGKGQKSNAGISREDFSAMAEMAEKEGVFNDSESKIFKNLLKFKFIQAKDIMTPRTVMYIKNGNMSCEEFYSMEKNNIRFSRIPIYNKTHEDIEGFVLKDDILELLINKKGKEPLSKIKRDILKIPNTISLPSIFNKFIKEHNHIALVVDEYGTVNGIVTLEDVLETLLGHEIIDEFDEIVDLQKWARESWELRAKQIGIIK